MTKRRGKKEGGLYRRADGVWCAAFTIGYDQEGQRKRRVVYGKTKGEVQKKLLGLQSSSAAGTLIDLKRMRLADYMKHWLEDVSGPTIRSSTYVRYESLIRTHLNPGLGGVHISSLEPSQVLSLYKTLEKNGVSARTRQFVHAVLRKALQQAMKLGYAQRNVCDLITRPRVAKKAMKCWTEEQTNHFLTTAKSDRLFGLYVLAFGTGLRQGELMGLQWSDIDLNDGSLAVQRTVHELRGKIEVGEPKTAKGRRKIELPDTAIRILKEHRVKMLAEGNHGLWVFCDRDGGPLRRSNFRKRCFMPLLKQSGLPQIRFHDLRHTAATLLLTKGAHPKVVQERLGHAQISITLDTYSHVLPSMQKDAAKKIDSIFAGGF